MKYAIPTDDGKTVSGVFGRAASFAIYDDEGKSLVVVPNEGAASEHGAGTGAASFLAERGIGSVLAAEVGPKAASALAAAGIAVFGAKAGAEIDESLKSLGGRDGRS